MFCTSCGHQVDDNEKFCPNCGTKLQDEANPVNNDYRYDYHQGGPDNYSHAGHKGFNANDLSKNAGKVLNDVKGAFQNPNASGSINVIILVLSAVGALLMIIGSFVPYYGIRLWIGSETISFGLLNPGSLGKMADFIGMGRSFYPFIILGLAVIAVAILCCLWAYRRKYHLGLGFIIGICIVNVIVISVVQRSYALFGGRIMPGAVLILIGSFMSLAGFIIAKAKGL